MRETTPIKNNKTTNPKIAFESIPINVQYDKKVMQNNANKVTTINFIKLLLSYHSVM